MDILFIVEKTSVLDRVDLLLCRSVQLLVLSYAKIASLHVSFTACEYFYKLSKSASFSRWLLRPVTQKNQ